MPNALLIDTVRCTGSRGCMAACKQWNLLPAVETTFSPTMTNPPEKNAFTYVDVEFLEIPKANDEMSWHFVSKRCFHCVEPACAKTCPPNAIKFGEREELLSTARSRISDNPNKYFDHVYGEQEAGGTSLFFLSSTAPGNLNLNTDVEEEPYPDFTWEFLSKIPVEIGAVAALMGGAWYFRKKRLEG